MTKINNLGYTLIEVLIAMTSIAVLSIIVTYTIALTMRNSNKSVSTLVIKENLDTAIFTIQRYLRQGENLVCDATNNSYINFNYIDSYGNVSPSSINCATAASPVGNVSFTSNSITTMLSSSNVSITACSLVCNVTNSGIINSVTLSLTGTDPNRTGVDGATATAVSSVTLRNK